MVACKGFGQALTCHSTVGRSRACGQQDCLQHHVRLLSTSETVTALASTLGTRAAVNLTSHRRVNTRTTGAVFGRGFVSEELEKSLIEAWLRVSQTLRTI